MSIRAAQQLLLGREELLTQVASSLRVGGVLLYGPPGIGKSSLLEAAAAKAAEDGCFVLRTTGGAADSGLPYVALFDLFGGLLDRAGYLLAPHLREALGVAFLRTAPVGEPADLLAIRMAALELARLLTAKRQVLIVCDDAQWIDPASSEVLSFVARRLASPALSTLVAERVEPGDGPIHASLCVAPANELAVPALSEADVTRLLRARFADAIPSDKVRRMSVASGGNPFLAKELGRAATQEAAPRGGDESISVPQRLKVLVGQRVAALPPEVRAVLLVAAAAARPTRELLAACRADADELLAVAVEAGVVRLTADGAVRFAHPLLAEIVYGEADPADRRAVHRALASHLDDVVDSARHTALGRVEPDEAVASLLDEAAEVARWRGAPLRAADLAELAAGRTPATDAVRCGKRLLMAAQYAFAGGDPERARRLSEAAVALGDAPTRVAARLLSIDASGENRGRLSSVYQAALADAGDDPMLAARVWRYHIEKAVHDGDLEGALRAAAEATRLAEVADDRQLLIDALVGRGMAETAMGRVGGEDFLERAFTLADDPSVDLTSPVVEARQMWAVTLARRGDTRAAVQVIAALCADVERAGRLHDLGLVMYFASTIYHRAGRCADSYAVAQRGGRLLLDTEATPGIGLLLLGCGELHSGSLELALQRMDEAVSAFTELGSDEWLGLTHGMRGRAYLAAGDMAAAADALGRSYSTMARIGYRDPAVFPINAEYAEALVGVGRYDEAAEVLAETAKQARNLGRDVILLGLERVEALLRGARGDVRGAADDLRLAIETCPESSYPLDIARAWLSLATLERRGRRRSAARAAAINACTGYEAAAATAWLQAAQTELARIDGGVGEDKLTASEAEIVEMVCAGATNREIASTLHLSVKAVEGSLTRLFRRLGVRNRAELVHTFDGAERPRF